MAKFGLSTPPGALQRGSKVGGESFSFSLSLKFLSLDEGCAPGRAKPCWFSEEKK
jgi:hypothetical protein